MYDRNRPAIALLLPGSEASLSDDPRSRDAALDRQLDYLEQLARRARRRAAARGPSARDEVEGDEDDEDRRLPTEDDDTELAPRSGRLC